MLQHGKDDQRVVRVDPIRHFVAFGGEQRRRRLGTKHGQHRHELLQQMLLFLQPLVIHFARLGRHVTAQYLAPDVVIKVVAQLRAWISRAHHSDSQTVSIDQRDQRRDDGDRNQTDSEYLSLGFEAFRKE